MAIISGHVLDNHGIPLSGINVTIFQTIVLGSTTSGYYTKVVQTDTNGFYSDPNVLSPTIPVADSSVTKVYPSSTTHTFKPDFTYNNIKSTDNLTADFIGYSFVLSGYITKPDSSPVINAKITIQQQIGNTLVYYTYYSDSGGKYISTLLPGFVKTNIVVNKIGCTFPPNATVWLPNDFNSDKTWNVQAQNCIASYSITGRTTIENRGLANIKIVAKTVYAYSSGVSEVVEVASVLSGTDGYYVLDDLPSLSYTISPSGTNCTFSPSSKSLSLTSNKTDINFAATCTATPKSVIKTDITFGAAPLTVVFDASDSSEPYGYTLTYAWDFGDNTNSTSKVVTHEYTLEGEYSVTLVVTSEGVTSTATTKIIVGMPIQDTITFTSGPLQGQCFGLIGTGSDTTGNYISFKVPLNYTQSTPFDNAEDYYAALWFMSDLQDSGLIGDFEPPVANEGSPFAFQDSSLVDQVLSLPPHTYNGEKVPVSHPSIFCAKNYSYSTENAQFIYLAYQVFENSQWRIYLRQIRLSEYNRDKELEALSLGQITLSTLLKYKGTDIGDPILISAESAHCMHPVVKVDYNNNVYIAYEVATNGIPQIVLVGTSVPTNFLPGGAHPRDFDSTLNYFYTINDFVYRKTITTESVNQSPDMFIDLNNTIHLVWESSRDNAWEIYYAKSSDFNNIRITENSNKSLKPKISADNYGNIFIVWHDNRFGNWEVMSAYKIETRVLPLDQQNTYLAGVKKGYTHYSSGNIPVILTNSTYSSVCFSKITVNFYKNPSRDVSQFSINTQDQPFAFTLPGPHTDTTNTSLNFSGYGGGGTFSPPEVDTSLLLSDILSVSMNITIPGGSTVQIAFRGSDTASDPNAAYQWTSWINIVNGSNVAYYGSQNVSGRYKQVKFQITGSAPTFISGSLTSIAQSRICLSPGETTTAYFNLIPIIDGISTPLSLPIESNQTYFISASGTKDDGSVTILPLQPISVSCENCSYTNASWEQQSCTMDIPIENTSSVLNYYNIKLEFYEDFDRTITVKDIYGVVGNLDLSAFSVNNTSAITVWGSTGLAILPGYTTVVQVIPRMVYGEFICGVPYYINVKICEKEFNDTSSCLDSDFVLYDQRTWVCNCDSPMWDPYAPIPIQNLSRWKSSGFGFSDTRITNTNSNNLNPVIKLRSNLNGVILYQTNRDNTSPNTYSIYASIFNAIPNYEMYASAGQHIDSGGYVLAKMDIPLSTTNTGVSPDFDIDLFDNIFAAWELPFSQEERTNLVSDKKQKIVVHRCGANTSDVIFSNKETTTDEKSTLSKNILDANFSDVGWEAFVRQLQIRNEDIDYYVNRQKNIMPVVSKCDISFTLVGTPESIAYRIRNGKDQWSEWFAFESLIGDYTIEKAWKLSPGSGTKTVSFQVATPAGLTVSTSISILADYKQLDYSINFYKSPQKLNTNTLTTFPFADEATIFVDSNKVNSLVNLPVLSLRPPTVENDQIVDRYEDYIFVEIVPDQVYLKSLEGQNGIEPVFDVVTQGFSDQYNVKTYSAEKEGLTVFRGVFSINKEGYNQAKDGLSHVIVHFKQDCAEASTELLDEKVYNKDQYNLMQQKRAKTVTQEDIFAQERNLIGKIKDNIVIRPFEDPYFVFGNPDFYK